MHSEEIVLKITIIISIIKDSVYIASHTLVHFLHRPCHVDGVHEVLGAVSQIFAVVLETEISTSVAIADLSMRIHSQWCGLAVRQMTCCNINTYFMTKQCKQLHFFKYFINSKNLWRYFLIIYIYI